MHLEGSLGPSLLFSLASRNKIDLPSSVDASFASPASLLDRYSRFSSLDDFLHYYFIGMSVLIHAKDFEALAWEYFVKAKEDNVLHAEVFFDPQAHTGRGVAYKTVVEGFVKACKRAEKELGMSILLILCFLRHLPSSEADSMLEVAKNDLINGTLAGIGLDSTEKDRPPELFKTVYESAKGLGIRRTAHAGEEAGADMIRQAIDRLDIQRIDHGRRMVEDDELMAKVAERKMLVTMCPISNLKLQGVKSIKDMPVRTFLELGIQFSINSDDPAYFGGYVLDNYCAVQEAFNLTIKDWENIAKGAVEGSWCSEDRKNSILQMVSTVVTEFQGHR
ncbi:adenine deaminase [Schaereria dolodes]|nr:adenine deaminase [Schaereria dolodes]